MDTEVAFLLYAGAFRGAVIAAGVICVFLGYRLFCRGVLGEGLKENAIEARVGGAGLTLKNAAPGTAFALFGAGLIATMTIQGMPQFARKPPPAGTQDSAASGSDGLTMRGEDQATLHTLTQRGQEAERLHKTDEALRAYEQAVNQMAAPINNLAWLYIQRGDMAKALPLARLATQLGPGDGANRLDTLATALQKNGNIDEAVKVMREAVRVNPELKAKLDVMEAEIHQAK
jgi:tetratricopeptide (TPR) repeat protein